MAEKYIQKAESLNFQIEKTTCEVQNLYPRDFVALGDAYTILGTKLKAKSNYQKAVETWQNLQTSGKLYPNQLKNLAEASEKLKLY